MKTQSAPPPPTTPWDHLWLNSPTWQALAGQASLLSPHHASGLCLASSPHRGVRIGQEGAGKSRGLGTEGLASGPAQQADCVTPPLRPSMASSGRGGITPAQTTVVRRAGVFGSWRGNDTWEPLDTSWFTRGPHPQSHRSCLMLPAALGLAEETPSPL